MTVLSDRDIRRRLNFRGERTDEATGYTIGIKPCQDHRVQPASVDLTLSNEWLTYPRTANERGLMVYVNPESEAIDMDDAKSVKTDRTTSDEYLLFPHQLVLASTEEYVEIPPDIQASVHGKSSLGRLGLLVHVTAGFIDPGFKGKITLEMYNLNNVPILLRAGKSICQLSLMKLTSVAEFPYGHPKLKSKYQNQGAVTGSRYDG